MSGDAAAPRAQFGSRLGFVLAAVGSAVGFGSIARFPMNVANNGGAAFVLLYAVVMVVVGIPMMVAEFSLGRDAQRNPVGAFARLTGDPATRWRWAGAYFCVLAAFFLSWYSIASGWVLRYVFASLSGSYFRDPDAYFADTLAGPDTLLWHFAVVALTFAGVTGRISKGIEKINLVLMPALFAMIVGLAVYAATLPGVGPGYSFYLRPEFGRITVGVVAAAVGQAFFSLSLGLGGMMTYASYLPRATSLVGNAVLISTSTLGFAVVAGFMVFPLLAAFGLLGTGAAGLGLIFGPLPLAFAQLGTPVGPIVGALFFLATFFAAYTSAVALTEPAISYVTEEWRIPRPRAAALVCAAVYAVGIAVAFSPALLDVESGDLTNAGVILGGLLIALYVGWFSPAAKARARMDECDRGWRLGWAIRPMARWVFPFVLAGLLLFTLAGTPCALGGDPSMPGLLERAARTSLLGCRAP